MGLEEVLTENLNKLERSKYFNPDFDFDPSVAIQPILGAEWVSESNRYIITYQNENSLTIGCQVGKDFENFLVEMTNNKDIFTKLKSQGGLKNINGKLGKKYLRFSSVPRSDDTFQMSVTDVTEVVLSHERFKILHDSVGLMNAGKEYIHERLEDAFKILVDYSGWEGEIIPEMSKVFLKRNGKYICYEKKENHNEEKDRLPDLVQICDGFKPDNCICDRSISENEIRSNICNGTRIVTLPLGTSSNVPAFARLHFKKTYNPTDEEIYTNNELIDSFRQTLASIILLDRHAYYDQLTDLPKRELLEKNIKQYMSLYDRDEKEFGVIFFDLDGFKSINDNHGHTMGDKLLQNVGSRLSEQVRAYDVVSRVGGDEFAGVILGERDKVKFVAERIFSKIIEPYIIDGKEYSIGASMGISYFPDQKTPEALLKEADSRMYAVKNRGKGFILNYNPDDTKLLPVIYDPSFADGLIGNKSL